MAVVYGTPSMSLIKAKEYSMETHGKHRVTIPIRGKYVDLDPNFYTEEHGSFDLFVNDTLHIADISNVLFATKQYPDLEEGMLFVPIVIGINGDDLELVGEIITIASFGETK